MLDTTSPAGRFAQLLDRGFERPRAGPLVTETVRVTPDTFRLTATRPAMGTLVSLIALGRSRARLEAATGSALAEMDRLIALFSRFEAGSAVSVLNDAGRLEGPPPELADLVAEALRFHTVTRGGGARSVGPPAQLVSAPGRRGPAHALDARRRPGPPLPAGRRTR